VSHNGHDDVATRLRREASATAPERLRADVMLRVRAEPRPQRIRPRRRFGRSFATVAAAACILGALVFGMSRVDFGGNGSVSGAGGGSAGVERASLPTTGTHAAGARSAPSVAPEPQRAFGLSRGEALTNQALRAAAVPGPLRAAIYGRSHLVAPLRRTFGALDPYHLSERP
jgi:hypothetical protein